MEATAKPSGQEMDAFTPSREEVLEDYRLACESREASLLGRREVLTGKAKFGIFGDGKEVAQLAMAKAFQPGDVRSGYYRDQTFMFASGLSNVQQFFAQLYADPDPANDPASSGRQMNAHFSTAMLNADGSWREIANERHTSADVSPTGSQMPRLVGLAYASKLYRQLDGLRDRRGFSNEGNEIAFGTIGNASCAEGMFWEAVNAVGVLQAPMILSIWDDEYGISVPQEYQIARSDLSELLGGFARPAPGKRGYLIRQVKGHDYVGLCQAYAELAAQVRAEHVPAILHVTEVTQPQGHSTSGSHERYKSKERLAWEEEWDCIRKMREWIEAQGHATAAELDAIQEEAVASVQAAKDAAWQAFREPMDRARDEVVARIEAVKESSSEGKLDAVLQALAMKRTPIRRDLAVAAHEALLAVRDEDSLARQELARWLKESEAALHETYADNLHSSSAQAAMAVEPVPASFVDDSPTVNGFEVMQACFDAALANHPEVFFFGEDVGHIGGVNQGLAGMQEKYGKLRVSDTGIRECTILGQAIGTAMRGLRPICEMQYLDYVLYALQIMSDDLATVRYRSRGTQKAPVIIRTRGHRLEGIWHSGSPMAGIINLVRGIYVCVPRNMVQASGFYNTLLASDDSGLVVEVLNGYRSKERLPANIGKMRLPLGVPEVLREGTDVTVVTYGACCPIALAACQQLEEVGISVELIDVQTLLPFDVEARIVRSLEKTNRVVFLDEDVPGGTTAYMMQQVLEAQGGYEWLDSEPRTLSATDHRPAYGSDGDYYSKPSRETIFRTVYELMHEADPARYPVFYE